MYEKIVSFLEPLFFIVLFAIEGHKAYKSGNKQDYLVCLFAGFICLLLLVFLFNRQVSKI